MKKMMLMLVALLFMTMAMAQNANGRQSRKMDAATVTTMMTQKLGLNADQQKKVEALNKKYERKKNSAMTAMRVRTASAKS